MSYLQNTSIPQKMQWHLTKPHDDVLLGGFGMTVEFFTNTGKHVAGQLLGSLKKEYLVGETPKISSIFLNCFAVVHGEFPYQDFRPLGWMHSSEKGWWYVLTAFILQKFESPLTRIGFYRTIRAVQHGIQPSCFHFF